MIIDCKLKDYLVLLFKDTSNIDKNQFDFKKGTIEDRYSDDIVASVFIERFDLVDTFISQGSEASQPLTQISGK
jgi:hypothetical protein